MKSKVYDSTFDTTVRGVQAMSSETTLAAAQFRLQECTTQIRIFQESDRMSIVDWYARYVLTETNYYYRIRSVRKACLLD